MLLLAALLLAFPALGLTVAQQTAPAPTSARVWEGRTSEYEEFLRTAPIVKTSTIELGVTHPKRVYFAPGGLCGSAAWKPLQPGYQNGYYESYKSEVAAYELDKLLKLNMVPVIVERKIDNATGALVLWLDGVRTWTDVLPLPKPESWSRQLARMKLFDDLIGNPDRNKGNLLVDADWNLFLIDHSRAFIDDRALPQTLDHVDTDLWTRITALDEASLQAAVGTWLTSKQIKAMLARRDKMAGVIDGLVKKNGRRNVFAW
jgi:hypothetical protein